MALRTIDRNFSVPFFFKTILTKSKLLCLVRLWVTQMRNIAYRRLTMCKVGIVQGMRGKKKKSSFLTKVSD